MRGGLAGIAAGQAGLFLRRQALACGYSSGEFQALTKRNGGPWKRVRYGVYILREEWVATPPSDRARLLDRAAALVCNHDAVLSHSSAARMLDIPVVETDDQLSHVTRIGNSRTAKVEAGIKHHRARLPSGDITRVDGLACTTALRTVVDMTREFGFRTGLVAADAALRAGACREALLERASAMTHEPGGPAVKAMVTMADPGAQTPIETLGRIVLTDMGIADLRLQYRIDLPLGGFAEVDLYSPSLHHIFECDGRLKYVDQYDDRGRPRSADDVLWLEKRREDQLRGMGYGVSRMVWSDVLERNFGRVSARLRQEIKQQGAARTPLRRPDRRSQPAMPTSWPSKAAR